MKKIKEFKKRGCMNVVLGYSELLGYCVAVKYKKVVVNMYVYDTIHESLEMFWYLQTL